MTRRETVSVFYPSPTGGIYIKCLHPYIQRPRQRLPTLTKKLGGPQSRVAIQIHVTSAMPFCRSLVKPPASLGCSDYVYARYPLLYQQTYIKPRDEILLRKKLRSLKLGVFKLQRWFFTLITIIISLSPSVRPLQFPLRF